MRRTAPLSNAGLSSERIPQTPEKEENTPGKRTPMTDFPLHEVLDQFRRALQGRDILPPAEILADGRLHRCDAEGQNGRGDAAYLLHLDGIPAGGFRNWRDGLGWENWRAMSADRQADLGSRLSPDEWRVHQARIEEQQRLRKEKEIRRQQAAAARAARLWAASPPAPEHHPYLVSKGVPSFGLRCDGDWLLVPVRDRQERLLSLQRISPDGRTKRFLAGSRTVGGYFAMGPIQALNGSPLRICIAEGYATGASLHLASNYPVAVAFSAGNLLPVAQALREKFPPAQLILCADDDWQTPGNPGLRLATEAARAVGGRLAVPGFGPERAEGDTDFNDLHRAQGLEAVRHALDAARPLADGVKSAQEAVATLNPEADLLSTAVYRLAALSPLEYDRVRESEAKTLGVRVTTLDRVIAQTRGGTDKEPPALVEDLEPWPAPVEGAALLETIHQRLTRHAVLPEGAASALSLWVLGSYAYDAFRIWPKLCITSPEKRCGKTTLMEVLGGLCQRALVASGISPAAVFRVIEAWRPTLLIDEADTFLSGNEELRGVINSGHTKSGAFVIRTVGDDHEPRRFSTWAPMAIAMIRLPPGTILDRSLVIRLRRKLPGERVEKCSLDFAADNLPLRRQALRWACDHLEALRRGAPILPASTNDRALDNWTPLFALAEAAGGNWPQRVVAAFHHLNQADEDEDAVGPMILSDIRRVFAGRGLQRLHAQELIDGLLELEERPWAEWRHGKPLTATGLARLLRPYRIASRQLRIGHTNRNGYEWEDFRDAFARYLVVDPPEQTSTPLQAKGDRASREIQSSTPPQVVDFSNSREPASGAACRGVELCRVGCRPSSPPSTQGFVEGEL